MLNKIWLAFKDLYSLRRRAGRAEWLFMLLASGIIPLVGVAASIRRLHDMGRSPLWTLPLMALPLMIAATLIPIRFMAMDADSWKLTLSVPTVVALVMTAVIFIWMCMSGSTAANEWGAPAEKGGLRTD